MTTKLMRDFEKHLESTTSVKPYYQHHKDNGFRAHLEDAKRAIRSGNLSHARQCIDWAKQARLSAENDCNIKENAA